MNRPTHWLFAALAVTAAHNAFAIQCPDLPPDASGYLRTARSFFSSGSNASTNRFSVAQCAYVIAKDVLETKFESIYVQQQELTLRLVEEAADLQRAGQGYAREVDDSTAQDNFVAFERELREKAIAKLSGVSRKPVAELVKHYSNLLSLLAQRQQGLAIRDTVVNADDFSFLDTESRFNYLRSVASCPAWDVKSADNMDSVILRARLKTAACDEAADDALTVVCPKEGQSAPLKLTSLLGKFARAGKACRK